MADSVATPKLTVYAALAGGGLIAAVAFQQPALAALAAPFALVLVAGLALHRTPRLRVTVAPRDERTVEGDLLTVEAKVGVDQLVDRVEVLLVPKDGFAITPDTNPAAVAIAPHRTRTVAFTGRTERWGVLQLTDIVVRTRDLLGLFVREARFQTDDATRVYPTVESLRRFARPHETQVLAGNQTARVKGEGVEFADLRPFTPGDRMRDVNWRVTARRGEMWVNQRHPDRNADVVLFLDVFAEAHLDDAVRAASMLVTQYLHGRDRVGLVSYGGTVRWLQPAGGTRQLYRMVDALIESQIFENAATRGIDVLPGRVLPPNAMVLALTPLEDPRIVEALEALRHRGRDVAVVEIAPSLVHAQPGVVGELSWRLWQVNRRSVRDTLQRLGIAVVQWPEVLFVAHDDVMPDELAANAAGPSSMLVRRRVALDGVGEELRAIRRRSQRVG